MRSGSPGARWIRSRSGSDPELRGNQDMAKTYGVGIMGAGNISGAYLRLAPLFKGLEVRGVADIVPAAGKKRSDEFNVKAMTPDELLKNSEIDVIVNLTVP